MTFIQVLADTLLTTTGSSSVDGQLMSLTVPATGHYMVGVKVSHSGSWYSSGGDPFITINVGGSAGFSDGGTTSGHPGGPTGMSGGFGYTAHADLTAGQTVTVSRTSYRCEGATSNGTMYLHRIPTPASPS